jgi:hypothetical protein
MLFAYSVEEQEGKLVVTVGGVLAQESLRRLRAAMETGGSLSLQTLLSPLVPIGRLLSVPSRLASSPSDLPASASIAAPSAHEVENLLSQEVDQSLNAFREQLAEVQEALEGLRGAGSKGQTP